MKKNIYLLSFILSIYTPIAASVDIGVYYYPGWNKPDFDAWKRIQKYPDRKPLLGWYKEGRDDVIIKQLEWMQSNGITYIAYDWYWDKRSETKTRTGAIDAYLRNNKEYNVKFSLLWANHTGTPSSNNDFDRMVDYWISRYFSNDKYLKINNKPVVFIFSPNLFEKNANSFGETSKLLIQRANEKARSKGFPGIYFIASATDAEPNLTKIIPASGYDAVSAYNYHLGVDKQKKVIQNYSYNYDELMAGYERIWGNILTNTTLPYIIPVTSGWDRRPWGGSENPKHDDSYSTPEQFKRQLESAKSYLEKYPQRTLNNIVICCWNEYGEGSYIEPTEKYKYSYLNKIKEVFD
nr:glycoside hydrolase family 99-like domain-containing protein [Raoultella terrigena]